MNCRLSLLLLLTLAGSSAEARRGPPTGTATLEWGYRAEDQVVVRGRLWRCDGNVCSGTLVDDSPAGQQRACRAIARRGHRVLGLETASGRLDQAALAACNR